MLNLSKLKETALAATKGRWLSTGVVVAAPAEGGLEYLVECCDGGSDHPNLEYIAEACPGAILELIQLLENQIAAAPVQAPEPRPELTVWYGAMPESNGRSNFTATLMRKGASVFDTSNYTFQRSEYPDRTRYEADCMRYLIGELAEEPSILDYDADKYSGYVAPVQPVFGPDPLYQAMHDFRDDVLSGIDGLDNDQINAVLGTFDNYMLDEPAAPAAQGDAEELTDDEIVQAVRSVGVDTHPSKFGFADEQIEGMSVTVLRQVIAAVVAKAAQR